MYYQTIENDSEFLVDERFDAAYSHQKSNPIELKKLNLENHTASDPKNDELNSDVFYFKEDVEEDYDSIQPVSNITTNKMSNVYIPMISPIVEEEESEEEEELIIENTLKQENKQEDHSACTVSDYNLDLVAYYKDIILSTMDLDGTVKSSSASLPNLYKHYIQTMKSANPYFL